MAHLLQIFISLLAISILSEAKHGVKHYTHKFDFVLPSDKPLKVSLNCSETLMEGTSIDWKAEGQPKPIAHGPQLERTIWGIPDAGIFTCWNGTKLLSHHTVLLRKKTSTGELAEPMLTSCEEHSRTYIKCTANNYSDFTCSWNLSGRDPNLKFKIGTGNGNHTSQITCDEPKRSCVGKDSEVYTVSCRKENFCTYSEEYEPIIITLEVVDKFVYEEHIHSFFIKDIIKPDACECQIVEHDQSEKLTWTHPKTWSTPESYFRLTYQIQTVHNRNSGRKRYSSHVFEVDDTTVLRNGSILSYSVPPNRGACIFIRSRDYYNKNAAWSSWSDPCRRGSQKNHKADCHNQEVKTKVEKCKCLRN